MLLSSVGLIGRKEFAPSPIEMIDVTLVSENDEAVGTPRDVVDEGDRPNLFADGCILAISLLYLLIVIVKGGAKNNSDAFSLVIFANIILGVRFLARSTPIARIKLGARICAPSSFKRIRDLIPKTAQTASPFIMLVGVILTLMLSALLFELPPGSTASHRWQSILGVIVFLAIMYVTSSKRTAINWQTVGGGMALKVGLALILVRTQLGFGLFSGASRVIVGFLQESKVGMTFLIGPYAAGNFVLTVFPVVIFFCAFIQVLYYWGIMQVTIEKIAWVTHVIMLCSGAEAIVAAASPFVGQGESAMLVRPFIAHATRSEIHAMMTSGYATIAGSVLIAYISFGIDANTLLTACAMSIPTALLLSKMRVPETEISLTKETVTIPPSTGHDVNVLHAAANGAALGVQIVLLIGGSILAIVSLFAVANTIVGALFELVNIYESVNPAGPHLITIQFLLSYMFAPFAWLMGIPGQDVRLAGEILASKILVNEFVAYLSLSAQRELMHPRTFEIMSLALCGFANLGSLGVQVGALTVMAPARSHDFAQLAWSAMLTGTVSTWISAAICACLI